MAGVILNQVGKVYSWGIEAVKGISLTVPDGYFCVLVGPSGCGKSTLLRMIAGIETITSGEIRIGERVVNGIEPADRDIAMVFQSYALYPHMNVYENMASGLRIATPRQRLTLASEEAASMLEIEMLFHRKPRESVRRPAPARRHGPRHCARSRAFSSTSRSAISTPS